MKDLSKTVDNVNVTIDRINFSLPLNSGYKFNYFMKDYEIKKSGKDLEQYFRNLYKIGNAVLTTKYRKRNPYSPIRPRLYCNLVKASDTTQQLICENIDDLINGRTGGDFGAILHQVEVAYDIYPINDYDLDGLKAYIDHHLFVKYAKSDSYNTHLNTIYAGNKGNARNAYVGLRIYPGPKENPEYLRIEFQYNKKYLWNNNITYLDMPLLPYRFNALDRIKLLDDFSDRGIKNINRIVRKRISNSKSKLKDKRLASLSRGKMRTKILGGERGKRKLVRDQIDIIKQLRKKYNLTSTYMNCFPLLDDDFQLIKCLSGIAYEEQTVSKRKCFCQA